MVSAQKKTQVVSLVELLQKNTNLILVNFDKTTHQSLESLRRELKKSQTSLKIIKNTLFEKAVNKLSENNSLFADFKKAFLPLRQSSALITFSGDWSEGLHVFYNFLQKEKTLGFKSGILDKKLYADEELLRIAKLPSRNQLIATIVGAFKSPSQRFVFALKFNTNKFIYILKHK